VLVQWRVYNHGRRLAQAKLEHQETQIRELQGALRQMELDRARQQAELNTLSQLWTGAGPLPTRAFRAFYTSLSTL
jgi:hypothetical protein